VNKIYAVLKIKGKNGPSTSSKAIRKTMIASSETQSRQGFPGLADFLKKKLMHPRFLNAWTGTLPISLMDHRIKSSPLRIHRKMPFPFLVPQCEFDKDMGYRGRRNPSP